MDFNDSCPYCNKPIYREELPTTIEEYFIIQCEVCLKKFRIKAILSYITIKDCNLNEEEHDWSDMEENFPYAECSQCDELRFNKD